ncbi:Alcohol dehydrogenase GroES-associated [Micromonospora viridifaciens]|uniref:Alcohol dehydrogenase GroES-associated n=2 Tax=Micromonospora viridifaciens TaxID=1881 RepID=A0A1C4Z536_MICVI|nr:Alcohol dehydrogenase GroES-associated [Micromonospora viridifaciens]
MRHQLQSGLESFCAVARPRGQRGRVRVAGRFKPRLAGSSPMGGHPERGHSGMKALTWHGKRDVRVEEVPDRRGPDAVIDAVGMEAHGAPLGKLAQAAAGLLPDKLAQTLTDRAGVDRLVPLDVEDLRTHRLPLEQAPQAYEMFQKKQDGCVKVVLAP